MSKTAIEESRSIIAAQSKSFSLASRLLSADVRDATTVVYAYCRRADDAVDLVAPERQGAAIERLERELASIYDGEAQPDPILAAFQKVIRDHGVPRKYPAELLAGMRMDVDNVPYDTYETLCVYCYRVAGTVGLMMSHVLGVRNAAALRNAAHLGMGMQLTNICRDVEEDWARGRLYLPSDLLAGFSASALREHLGNPLPAEARGAVDGVIRELLCRADAYYASGDRGIPALSFRSALAVRTARLVYSDIGRELLSRPAGTLGERAVVSTPRKLFLLPRAVWETIREVPERFVPARIDGEIGFEDVLSV